METGGTERVTHDLINELVKRGYPVNLICLQKKGVFLEDLLITDDKIFEIGTSTTVRKVFAAAKKIKKILKQNNSD